MGQQQMAEELNISRRTVQRNLDKLVQSGLVVSTKDRYPNRYKVSSVRHCVTASQLPLWSNSFLDLDQGKEVDSSVLKSLESLGPLGESLGHCVTPPLDSATECRWWTPTSTPPVASGKRLHLRSPEIFELCAYFEHFVAPLAANQITDERNRKGWINSATWLLVMDRRPVSEVAEVISWIFNDCDGRLPGTIKCKEPKVTRLDQIRRNYDRLLEEKNIMRKGIHPPKHLNEPQNDAQAHNLANQVDTLVGLWRQWVEKYHPHHQINDKALASWSKTFRISLTGRRVDFEDLCLVLTTLLDPRFWYIERERFVHPLDLWKLEGWTYMLDLTRAYESGRQKRSHATPETSTVENDRDPENAWEPRLIGSYEEPFRQMAQPLTWSTDSWEHRRGSALQAVQEMDHSAMVVA